MAPGVAVRPSAGSGEGRIFTSCAGAAIPNLGEQELHVVTDNGMDRTVLFQLADVSRPLMSVSAICDRGNRVIFGRRGDPKPRDGPGNSFRAPGRNICLTYLDPRAEFSAAE